MENPFTWPSDSSSVPVTVDTVDTALCLVGLDGADPFKHAIVDARGNIVEELVPGKEYFVVECE